MFPEYTAVIECVPTDRDDVANMAWWVDALIFRVASVAFPFLNFTEPLIAAPAGGTTVAVKVTDLPWVEGLREEAKVVVVAPLVTVCVSTFEVLPASFALPA